MEKMDGPRIDSGAWSGTQDATEEVQSICDEVKCQVEEKTGKKYGTFKAVKYRVMALLGGTHYLIMVRVGCEDYLHIRIVQSCVPTENSSVVLWVEEGHHECDPLIPEKGHHEHVGAWSETQDATEEVQSICDEVKCQVEEKTNKKYGTFKAVKYRSQVVAGMNYFIKVHGGCDDYLHIRVFQNIGGKSVVNYVEEGHDKCDPLILPP